MITYKRGLRLLSVLVLFALVSIATNAQEYSRYIIVFKDNVRLSSFQGQALANAYGLDVTYAYRSALNGIAANVPESQIQRLLNDPRIDFIEEDMEMSIVAQTVPTGIDRSFASSNPNLSIDGNDERIDVDVAILDTGIDFEHPDLNVVGGTDCTLSTGFWIFATYYCGAPGEGTGGDDDHYHGTHVAGTVAALDNGIGVVGVAPGARLWAVKVLDSSGSGFTSGIIAGIDWVVAQGDIEVINMSLGGSGQSSAYQTAIDNAVDNGVVVVVSAGNSNADSNNYSPAFVPSAITVSALADFDGQAGGNGNPTCRTDEDDTLANFSNWGSAVDIAAPGVCIYSTYPLEQGEYASISGTSMAAPHVAGAAALLASGSNSPNNAADVQAIRDTLVNSGNFNWTDDSGDGIQESLLDLSDTSLFNPTYVGSNPPPPPQNQAPTASFSYDCVDLNCTFDGTSSSDSDGNVTTYAWDFGDGASAGNVSTTSRLYVQAGTYDVTLTVTDDDGATDTQVQTVSVDVPPPPPPNEAPTASFTYSCTDLDCGFNGAGSSDSDGTVQSYDWNFGDGSIATGPNPGHTYSTAGTYDVTLTVTDDDGATDSDTQSVTVTDPPPPPPNDDSFTIDLSGSTASFWVYWRSIVTVTATDNNGQPVSGVTVNGSYGAYGSGSCTTTSSGTCSINSSITTTGVTTSMTFNVSSVSGGDVPYDAVNSEDSITINR
ncbi:MAG: S8 family serine peptidase [Chloroflexota bacterium]